MKLKHLIAGAALAVASVGAFAADQNVGVTVGQVKDFSGLWATGDALLSDGSDTLTFSGLATGTYSVLLSYSGVNVNITSASLNGEAPVEFFNSKKASLGTFEITDTTSVFTLILNGTVSGTQANSWYNGSILVTAVPEPETYGMMLGGLALLGVVARRKAKKAA